RSLDAWNFFERRKSIQMLGRHAWLQPAKHRAPPKHLRKLVACPAWPSAQANVGDIRATGWEKIRIEMNGTVAFRLKDSAYERTAEEFRKPIDIRVLAGREHFVEIPHVQRRRQRKKSVRIVRATLIGNIKA